MPDVDKTIQDSDVIRIAFHSPLEPLARIKQSLRQTGCGIFIPLPAAGLKCFRESQVCHGKIIHGPRNIFVRKSQSKGFINAALERYDSVHRLAEPQIKITYRVEEIQADSGELL